MENTDSNRPNDTTRQAEVWKKFHGIFATLMLMTGLAYSIKFMFVEATATQVYFGLSCWIIGFSFKSK